MQATGGRDFFENIRRFVKISYFVASIVPLALLIYIVLQYSFPNLELPVYFAILLFLAVAISLLGLSLLTRTTKESISYLQNLYGKLNTVIKITKQFRETLYIDTLLENIVKSAMHLNSAEAASLLLYDEEGNLRCKVLLGEQSQALKDRVIKRGKGISGWVAETGKPALINDVTNQTRFNPEFGEKESGFKTKSILCVPLIYNNEIIGVIDVLNKKGGVFTKEDEELLHSLADQAAISIAQSRAHESWHSDIIHITEILVSAQDSHSPDKKGHVRRVANYANLIGRKIGLSESDLKKLHYACLLHDVGFLKIEIGDPQSRDPREKEKYVQHPRLGYEMISSIYLWKDAAEIILNHHERYDGSGYPSGKKGEEIPFGARILFVAEVFDVLTSKNSYRKQIDYDAAIKEIEENAGSQFDPVVVKAFTEAIKDSDIIAE